MTARTIVIGVGHPYRRDDGVGPAVIDLLATDLPAGLACTVSSGEPTELIEAWYGNETAIVVDAVRRPHAEPGRIHRLVADTSLNDVELPGVASTHGIGLGHTLALARALDRTPGRLVVYAIEVADVGYGIGLSAPVAAAAATVANRIRHIVAADADRISR
jgi:hydrogenase maturation protease